MNNVLLTIHPMAGVDFHKELATGNPIPFPVYPHVVVAPLYWLMLPALAESVQCCFGSFSAMQRGTDIQSGILHIPIPPVPYFLLVPIYIAFSASKTHFGVASVLVENKAIAVANCGLIGVNLNCGDVSSPSGVVIAPNTVISAMTNADSLGGVYAMCFDIMLQAVMTSLLDRVPGINGVGEGLFAMLVGTPLGFGFNAEGSGPIGSVGKVLSGFNDWARAAGEWIGGDSDQAGETFASGWETMQKTADGILTIGSWEKPLGWDAQHDFDVITARPQQLISMLSSPSPSSSTGTGPSSSSPAFDNPGAEHY